MNKSRRPSPLSLDTELDYLLGAPAVTRQLADQFGVRTVRDLTQFDLMELKGSDGPRARMKLTELLFSYGLASKVHGSETRLQIGDKTVPIYDVLLQLRTPERHKFLSLLITAGGAYSVFGRPIAISELRALFHQTRAHVTDIDRLVEVAMDLASGERIAAPRLEVLSDTRVTPSGLWL